MSVRRWVATVAICSGALAATAGMMPASAAPPAPGHDATAAPGHDAAAAPATAPTPVPGRTPRQPEYTGRVVVQLADATAPGAPRGLPERARRAAESAGTAGSVAATTATGATVLTVQGDPVASATALAAQPGVEYAVAERRLFPATDPDDPGYPGQWDLAAIGVPQAWTTSRGAGVTVAVIDTGSLPHPDLRGQYLPGYDFISDPDYALDGTGRDADATDAGDWTPYGACEDPTLRNSSWHGIHVAGTIAALVGNSTGIAGIAPGARLLPVRALGRCGGTDTDITDALVWAVGGAVPGVPANPNPAKIVNLSLSGPGSCNPMEQRAIDQATARGALVIVAAGNDAADVADYTPANCRGVLVVGATMPSGVTAPYANSGAAVALSAPGSTIYSLGNSGTRRADPTGWTVLARSGTSMATPHVSAVAALVWSLAPTLTAAQVRDILVRTAAPFPGTATGFGAGILDAAAAVAAVRPQPLRAPTLTAVQPSVVRTRGGDTIAVTGTNLAEATATIGGRAATIVSAADTSLLLTVPAGTAGATTLVVTTPGGSVSAPLRYDVRAPIQRSGTGYRPTS